MSKFYLTSLLAVLAIATFGQHDHLVTRQYNIGSEYADVNMIPVHGGDKFTARTNGSVNKKRPFLSNLLKAIGLASATYQSEKLIEGSGKTKEQANNTNWLLPVGVGVIVSADKITENIFLQSVYLKYIFYNIDKIAVSDETIQVFNGHRKRNLPFIISRTVPSDGFIKMVLVDKVGKQISSVTDLVVNIESYSNEKKSEPAAIDISFQIRAPRLKIDLLDNFIPFEFNSLIVPSAPTFILPPSILKVNEIGKSKGTINHKGIVKRITQETESGINQSGDANRNISNRHGKLRLNKTVPLNHHINPPLIPPFIVPRRYLILRPGRERGGESEGDEKGPANFPSNPIAFDEYPSYDEYYNFWGDYGGGGAPGSGYDPCLDDPYAEGCDPCIADPYADGCDPCTVDPTAPGCGGDPCATDPYGVGCDPCMTNPYADGCDPCIADPYAPECCDPRDCNSTCYDPCLADSSSDECYCSINPGDDTCNCDNTSDSGTDTGNNYDWNSYVYDDYDPAANNNVPENIRKLLDRIYDDEGRNYEDQNSVPKTDQPTKFGVDWTTFQRVAKSILGIDATLDNLKNLTSAQADQIYIQNYFNPLSIGQINDPRLAYAMFNQGALGESRVRKTIKEALDIWGYNFTIDSSLFTAAEINAINALSPGSLLDEFKALQIESYIQVTLDHPSKCIYLKGWKNRVGRL